MLLYEPVEMIHIHPSEIELYFENTNHLKKKFESTTAKVLLALQKARDRYKEYDRETFVKMMSQEALSNARIEGCTAKIDDVIASCTHIVYDDQPVKSTEDNATAMAFGALNALMSLEGRHDIAYIKKLNRKTTELESKSHHVPGEFRTYNVRIGNIIPAHHEEIDHLINLYEKTISSHLVDIVIRHYQFEAIHPFGDGNGRTGRLLLLSELVEHDYMNKFTIPLSAVIYKHLTKYYKRLKGVTTKGDIENWVRFMLDMVHKAAEWDLVIPEERGNNNEEGKRS
jgi:Fic family protein